jgi:hypothetical protein
MNLKRVLMRVCVTFSRKFGEQIVEDIMKLYVKMLEKLWDCN